MGRINDALRRAVEEGSHVRATAGPAGLEYDIESLAREAFPIEIDEHRKTHRQPAAPIAMVPPAAAAPPAPAEESPAAADHAPSGASATRPVSKEDPAPIAAVNLPSARPASFDRIDTAMAGKIVIGSEIAPASREQYRRLAASLHHAQASHGLKVVMVTSAMMGEGKTLTSSNLALTLSESYKKNVLLIDADLRRPSIHSLFQVQSSPGLSEGLVAGEDERLAVRQMSPRLGVLTAGQPNADPIAGLTSPRMQRVIEEARDAFDWVIIDTPPVALLPDANLLAAMADGTILVVRAGATPWDLAQRAVQAIGRERVLGVVLNRSAEATNDSAYGYYDYYTAPSTGETSSP